MTTILGIAIPSQSPAFLAIVGVHVFAGLVSVAAGIVAMLSRKAPGRHPTFGTIYFWAVAVVFATASALAALRWREDVHLFVLGSLAFAAALIGRTARRSSWPLALHISGMGTSYILLLTAFYVDNGKNLPVWKDLPAITYWTVPAFVGFPIMIWALLCHPLMRKG